jgi:hypothetical protein
MSEDVVSNQHDDKPKLIQVEIDVEEIYSTSSEEEYQSEFGSKKKGTFISGNNSNQGSSEMNMGLSSK